MTRNNNTPPPLLNQGYKNFTAGGPESIGDTSVLSPDFQDLVEGYGWIVNTNQKRTPSSIETSYTQIKEKSKDAQKGNQEKQSGGFLSWLKGLFSRSEKTKEQAQNTLQKADKDSSEYRISENFFADRNGIQNNFGNMMRGLGKATTENNTFSDTIRSNSPESIKVENFFSSGRFALNSENAKNMKTVYQFFRDKGYPVAQTIGIISNIYYESKGSTTIRGDGGKAIGLVQMHPDRRRKSGYRSGDILSQLNAIHNELQGSESRANRYLFAANSAGDAAAAFEKYYERPKKKTGRRPVANALAGVIG